MSTYAEQALAQYNTQMAHPGGVEGRPFWNMNASQFLFAPSFLFPRIPGAVEYLFTAKDTLGNTHSFKAEAPTAGLQPIWGELPTGLVTLQVEALHERDGQRYPVGARTFFKGDPFPGRENLPPKARSYRESARLALHFVFEQPMVRHWLHYGKPDPEYPHNVYPAKTISSIIHAMVAFARLEPENAADALKLACRAADYLLSITYGEDSPLAGLPPTYSFEGLNFDTVDKTAPMAKNRTQSQMLIYPADAGNAYLDLAAATGEEKYISAALRIGEYYKATVLPCGSWPLMVSAADGKPESENICVSFSILNFMHALYMQTGDPAWQALEKGCYAHICRECLQRYNWEGQFEDIVLSGNYTNLTHVVADHMIEYIAQNLSGDAAMVAEAEDLLRFVEDQFVVWGAFAPWNPHYKPGAYWYSPAGLEQYFWHVPIDASTAKIAQAFLNVYTLTRKPLLLEKALALGDALTRMQNPENGIIPTHWMKKDCRENIENFWINCHIASAFTLMKLAALAEE